jgi:iduronate 2-sulfatase
MVFSRAFTQFPWCSPTRQSFMSGRRPDTTRAWTFTTSFRDALPNAVSLPQHFRLQGWHAASVGKIYHGRNCVRGDPGCCPANATLDQCVQQPTDADWAGGSWDEHPVDFTRVRCHAPNKTFESVNWCARPDAPESEYCDYKVAEAAISRLTRHASASPPSKKSLFLGIGFRDNHLPWAAPPKWRALFDPARINATAHGSTPNFQHFPVQAWQWPVWVGGNPETGKPRLSDSNWLQPRELQESLRSYMANIAFTDAQLGKVIGALDKVGYTNSTVALFTGDHGQNVGEHNTFVIFALC